MNNVIAAQVSAFKSLFHPRMLSLIVWPMLVAVLFWLGLSWMFWNSWSADLSGLIASTPAEEWMAKGFLAAVSGYLVTMILVMLLIPVVYVTALVITAVFAMPMMVNHVAGKYYSQLERKQGGTTAGSVVNSVIAIVVYCVVWLLTLPLWLLSPLAIALPIILSAYLNQRLFRYDALAEHASGEEYKQVLERSTGKLYLLGGMVGLLQFIPILNFFTPVYIGLAFIHFCLADLQSLRRQGPVVVEE
jgi:CysZ protein